MRLAATLVGTDAAGGERLFRRAGRASDLHRGGTLVGVGLVVAAGTLLLALVLRDLPWAVALFMAAGLAMAGLGALEAWDRATIERGIASVGGRAWLFDGYWARTGERRHVRFAPARPFPRGTVPLLAACGAASLVLYVADAQPQSAFGWLAVATAAAASAMAWCGRATVRVGWHAFPYFTGERATFEVVIGRRPSAAAFERLAIVLRCVEERPRMGGLLRPAWRTLHAMEVVLADEFPSGPVDVTVAFDIPADAAGTDLLAVPATYWELVLEGDGPRFCMDERFDVPVYRRPRAA